MQGRLETSAPKLRRAARAAFAAGTVAVTILSLLPYDVLRPETGLSDKLEHLLAYGVLAVTGAIGFPSNRGQVRVAVGLIGLACLLEVGQGWVPGRTASLADAAAGALGVAIGLAACRLLPRP